MKSINEISIIEYWIIPATILGLLIWTILVFTNPFIMSITFCHGLVLLTTAEFFNVKKKINYGRISNNGL